MANQTVPNTCPSHPFGLSLCRNKTSIHNTFVMGARCWYRIPYFSWVNFQLCLLVPMEQTIPTVVTHFVLNWIQIYGPQQKIFTQRVEFLITSQFWTNVNHFVWTTANALLLTGNRITLDASVGLSLAPGRILPLTTNWTEPFWVRLSFYCIHLYF